MAFGPNSTNLRERRAYAHAMISKAKENPTPENKIDALIAGNSASNTKKGENLGRQALNSIRNIYPDVRVPFFGKGVDFKLTDPIGPTGRLVNEEVAKALGRDVGSIVDFKPESEEEHRQLSETWLIEVSRGKPVDPSIVDSHATNGFRLGAHFSTADFGVPGTAEQYDLALMVKEDMRRIPSEPVNLLS
ncbi:MAG: hypothetical protein AAB914_02535 [Patescibacteria group bacterium]